MLYVYLVLGIIKSLLGLVKPGRRLGPSFRLLAASIPGECTIETLALPAFMARSLEEETLVIPSLTYISGRTLVKVFFIVENHRLAIAQRPALTYIASDQLDELLARIGAD